MGKRQHQKDKLYLTCTEWSNFYGGRRPGAKQLEELSRTFRRLRFDCCCLTFQPVITPYCNLDGFVFELSNIIPFIKKHGVDPINGRKIELKSLIKLNFSKTSDGKYQCPVLYKPFSENSHIVAIKGTGNVFSYEAVEQLNLTAKNFRDLLTDETFVKSDIITLQDPKQIDKIIASDFYHIKNKLKWNEEEEEYLLNDPNSKLRNMNGETKETLAELSRNAEEEAKKNKGKIEAISKEETKLDQFNAANYSTGQVAAGITSTACAPHNKLEAAILSDDEVRYSRVKKKGYVQLQTNFGPLNFELYCDQTTKTCDNFLQLCQRNYYDNTIFHRLIKNFMIQGGDPTGTGTGGESCWGKPFNDEIKSQLVHQGRGILSMANSGKNNNKSQFFITFRSCRHLDKKHTVFGHLVGGMQTLDKIEKVKTAGKDRPVEDVKILKTVIYTNPYKDVDDHIAKEREKLSQQDSEQFKSPVTTHIDKKFRDGIGSLIDLKSLHKNDNSADMPEKTNKKSKPISVFGNFSSW